jgi:hypothetical protein
MEKLSDDPNPVVFAKTTGPQILDPIPVADVVLFPNSMDEDGVGIYPEAAVAVVKELRAQGLDAEYLQPAAQRKFLMLRSHGEELLPLVIQIATEKTLSGLVDYLRVRMHKMGTGKISITLGRQFSDGNISTVEWAKADGPAGDVVKALEQLGWQTVNGTDRS